MSQKGNDNTPPKICFVAPNAYELLTGKDLKRIVGPDLHQVLLAKELVLKGFPISIITYCQVDTTATEYIDNIEIVKLKKPDKDYPLFGLTCKTLSFWKAMIEVNADIYYIRGGVPGIISLFSKIIQKKAVYSIASDAWVNRSIVKQKIQDFGVSRLSPSVLGNWLDIKLADQIIVQSEYQKKLLKKNYNKRSTLIRTPFPLCHDFSASEKSNTPLIIWVGSLSEVKRPELFIEIAHKMPDRQFQMIGGYLEINQKYERMLKEASELPNFKYIGVVPFDEIHEYFKKADVLINTSLFEGYPHAFIQAWAYQVPVVSLNVNPDELLTKYNLGIYSNSVEQMIKDIDKILSDETLCQELKLNGIKYVTENHDMEKIINSYIELFYAL